MSYDHILCRLPLARRPLLATLATNSAFFAVLAYRLYPYIYALSRCPWLLADNPPLRDRGAHRSLADRYGFGYNLPQSQETPILHVGLDGGVSEGAGLCESLSAQELCPWRAQIPRIPRGVDVRAETLGEEAKRSHGDRDLVPAGFIHSVRRATTRSGVFQMSGETLRDNGCNCDDRSGGERSDLSRDEGSDCVPRFRADMKKAAVSRYRRSTRRYRNARVSARRPPVSRPSGQTVLRMIQAKRSS